MNKLEGTPPSPCLLNTIPSDVLPVISKFSDCQDIRSLEVGLLSNKFLHDKWKAVANQIISPNYRCSSILRTGEEDIDGIITCILSLSDGKFLVTGSDNGTMIQWDLTLKSRVRSFSTGSKVKCLLNLPDGRFVSGCEDGQVNIWSVVTGECEKSIDGIPGAIYSLHFDTQLEKLVIISKSGVFTSYPFTGYGVLRIAGLSSFCGAEILSDGRLTVSEPGKVILMNLTTNTVDAEFINLHGSSFHRFKLLSNGDLLTVKFGTFMQVWSTQTREPIRSIEIKHPPYRFSTFFLSKDRVTLSLSRSLSLFDMATGKRLWCTSSSFCRYVVELSDGRMAASLQNTVNIWNLEKGQVERRLVGHAESICQLFQLPDGRLVSCSDDLTIRIWSKQVTQISRQLP